MPAHSSAIPTSTHARESRVISSPVSNVWEHVRPLTFSWLKSVKASAVVGGAGAEVGSQRTISYVDGTVQTVKVLEVSDLQHFVTWEVIMSEPAISVTSAVHTIRLVGVTHDNTTLVEWISDFSNDATQEVVQDSKYKKQEAFENLAAALAANSKKHKLDSPEPKSPKKAAKK